MRPWLYMLGGLIVWAVHFLGVYLIASIADVAARADVPPALWAVGGFTLACLAADALILAAAWRRGRTQADPVNRFADLIAGLGAGISFVAVAWQGLPALIGH